MTLLCPALVLGHRALEPLEVVRHAEQGGGRVPVLLLQVLEEAIRHRLQPAPQHADGDEHRPDDHAGDAQVDELVEKKIFRRVLAQTDVLSSNSMIEAWWRQLKHNWLFLNTLDTLSRLRSLVEFYVTEHNSPIPHSAFQGQTPRDAYLVKCDRETTTQFDRDRGIVNIVVGFAPLKPAEFVMLRIQQLTGQQAA